ncbi:MAG TPA: CARDB domain-containing protein, partial [archaeon]|nr:CARDB domain-containing protein [archaeon]
MKGITPVIAVILLLLITIAIIGFTSVFFQQTVTTGGEQAQEAAAGQANKALQTAEIVDVSNGKVTIKNIGTEAISTTNVQIFVDGDPAAITPVGDAENIQPGLTKTFDIAVPLGTGERKITVAVPGNTMEKTLQLDAGTADLISAEGNVITLKNSGVTSIQDSEISMKVDGAGVTFTGPASLAAGAEGVYTITPSSIP